MDDLLAIIIFMVLIFVGPIVCAVKAMLGIEQCKFLPKKFTDELSKVKNR